jgi:hypothetical protein
MDALRQTWNHDQRIGELISRPRLVDEFIGNHMFAIFESLSYFSPILDKEISDAVFVGP